MSNLVNLGRVPNINLFKGNFMPTPTLVSGSATFGYDFRILQNEKVLEVVCNNLNTTDVIFNFGNFYETPILNTNSFLFSLLYASKIESPSGLPIEIKIRFYTNNVVLAEFDYSQENADYLFHKIGQSLSINSNDIFNFDIVVKSNSSFSAGTEALYFHAPILFENYSELLEQNYKKGGNPTMWADRTDTVNTQNLTASTNNIVQITTATEGNSIDNEHLSLFDSNGKVTPINENDVISVDFACTVETPAGADRFVDVIGLVDGVSYRALTHKLLKGSGNDDQLSVSWVLPVKQAFKLNGLQIALNPNSNCTIKNRYISVTRLHEAL